MSYDRSEAARTLARIRWSRPTTPEQRRAATAPARAKAASNRHTATAVLAALTAAGITVELADQALDGDER